uniref:WD-repeat protein, putative n=1 Tax=Schistosoma mansoni TaxID=6183 RepID=A0A3Q0KGU0_SCHMA
MAAVASLKHIFGYRTGISGSIVFLDDQTIVYPCGSNLILYNLEQKTQKFIAGLEKSEGMTALAISPNRRYIALSEKMPDKPVVTVYDVHTLRKKKSLHAPDIHSNEFVSLAFSPDSKYLAVQSGSPEWILTYWSWEKPKQLASVKTSTSNPIKQISFSPQDCTLICVVGTDIIRLYRYAENNLKTYGINKVEPRNFLCHNWIDGEKIVAGTEDGRWILVENGESKLEYNVSAINEKNGTYRENKDITQTKTSITALASTAKGLLVASSSGIVYWFEHITADHKLRQQSQQQNDKHEKKPITSINLATKSTTNQTNISASTSLKDEYQLLGSVCLPEDLIINKDSDYNIIPIITQLQINPSEDLLIAATNTHQLYQFNLNNIDTNIKNSELAVKNDDINGINKEQYNPNETMKFIPVSQLFHNGQIIGMDVCLRKPLIVTCATDRTVRIWNFETNDLELIKQYAEEVYSVALHPIGLFILIGFSDKLRLMNILIDDLRIFHEFTIRSCRECAFSNGGHLIGAVNGNVIQIYSTTTFDNLINLKGHNGKIRSIIWSDDDYKLISCGLDGAVYEWDTQKGTRINENVLKSCSYTSVAVSQDAKTVYAVGSDKTLKEISDSQIIHEIQSNDQLFTTVTISRSSRMLFCGCQNGLIRSYQMPLTDHSNYQDYIGHCDNITKMKMASFDEYLITVSNDCSIIIWNIQERDARSSKTDKENIWMEEILITKSDLEEKNSIMNELKTRIEELKLENDYQLRIKDINYNERIKELTEKFIQEMETLKNKNQLLKLEKDNNQLNYNNQLNELLNKHNNEIQQLQLLSNQKLINEYNKYNELQLNTKNNEINYEKQLNNIQLNHENLLNNTINNYELKLNEKNQKINELINQLKQQLNDHDLIKSLIEHINDQEILQLNIKYKKLFNEELNLNKKLKNDLNLIQKQLINLQKIIDQLNLDKNKYNIEIQKLNTIIFNLEKDLQNLHKDIQERDDTIQDKEKRILDLKKKNQELEKFKYVLDYKIKELKQQIEPRENDIKNYKEQIQEMETELQRFHKQNDQLEINITELKQKYKSVENELKHERQSTRDVESIVRRLKTDLFNVVGLIQEPKQLKAGILALYKKHIHEDMAVDATADADIQKEFFRQREHLERSVAGLRQKLARDSEMHRSDYVRIMQENVTLIQEIDNLRSELKLSRNHIYNLEAILGLNRKNGDQTKQLLIQLNKSNSDPIQQTEYDQLQYTIKAQQDFIHTLQMKLNQTIQGDNKKDLLKELQLAIHSERTKSSSSLSPTSSSSPVATTTDVIQSKPYSGSKILPPINHNNNNNNNRSITESTDQKTFKSA